MKILITAFEPFGKRKRNTSADLLEELVRRPPQHRIQKISYLVLPVNFETVWPILNSAIASVEPDFILLMGENRREGICIERFAHNHRTTISGSSVISVHAPQVMETQVDLNILHARLKTRKRKLRCPFGISENAGNYLCNFVYFKTLTERPNIPAVFLHVPALVDSKLKILKVQYVSALRGILLAIDSQRLPQRADASDTKAIDGAGANDMPRENKRRTLMADKHLVACEQEHEMVTVLKHFKKGSSKENVDKMQNACRSWKKDGGAKYKPKNRDNFYKYLQEKGILGKLA
jgi:pyroglutamyl-peptidase